MPAERSLGAGQRLQRPPCVQPGSGSRSCLWAVPGAPLHPAPLSLTLSCSTALMRRTTLSSWLVPPRHSRSARSEYSTRDLGGRGRGRRGGGRQGHMLDKTRGAVHKRRRCFRPPGAVWARRRTWGSGAAAARPACRASRSRCSGSHATPALEHCSGGWERERRQRVGGGVCARCSNVVLGAGWPAAHGLIFDSSGPVGARWEAGVRTPRTGVGEAVGHVEARAELVRHGVADAQEGVGERHAGDRGGVVHLRRGEQEGRWPQASGVNCWVLHCQALTPGLRICGPTALRALRCPAAAPPSQTHLLAGLQVVLPVGVGGGQVLEQDADGLLGQAARVVFGGGGGEGLAGTGGVCFARTAANAAATAAKRLPLRPDAVSTEAAAWRCSEIRLLPPLSSAHPWRRWTRTTRTRGSARRRHHTPSASWACPSPAGVT